MKHLKSYKIFERQTEEHLTLMDIYQDFFTDSFVQEVLNRYQIKLLVFHVQRQEIVLWKN